MLPFPQLEDWGEKWCLHEGISSPMVHSVQNEEELAPDGEEDDDDGFFVPHGYLSEGEGEEDSDVETDQVKNACIKIWC